MGHVKAFLPKVKPFVDEKRVAGFQKGCTNFVKWVITKWDDIKFYEGPSKTENAGLVVVLKGRTFFIFADSVKKVKC